MKKTLLPFVVLLISLVSYSQEYNTGFDTQEDQDTWTIFRVDGTSVSNWTFSEDQSLSQPFSLFHDYPVGENVEDWIVSPSIYFPDTCAKLTLSSYKLALSGPPGIYFGIWMSYGSPNPEDGDYFELSDLTNFPSLDNVWADTSISFEPKNEHGYFAFKYKVSDSNWLMQWVDNINVENGCALSVNNLEEAQANLLFPNPATDYISLRNSDSGDFDIINQSGKIVFTQNQNILESRLDISALKPGVYFLRIRKDEEYTSYRFVKL